MDYKLFSYVLFLLVLTVQCTHLDSTENATSQLSLIEGTLRKGRAEADLAYVSLISCAVSYDTPCLLDAAGRLFEGKKNELLAQADLAAFQAGGRADPENSPSQVAKTIEQLMSQLSGLFKDTFYGLFSAKEGDDDDEVVNPDDKDDSSGRGVNGEERKKKKKRQYLQYLKHLIICAAIASKLGLLSSLLQTALLLKLALLGIGILGVSVAKLVVAVKHGKQKAIYYENSQHDHHYEHDDIWHDDHQWGRSFSQNLAYSKHRHRSIS